SEALLASVVLVIALRFAWCMCGPGFALQRSPRPPRRSRADRRVAVRRPRVQSGGLTGVRSTGHVSGLVPVRMAVAGGGKMSSRYALLPTCIAHVSRLSLPFCTVLSLPLLRAQVRRRCLL